MLSDMKVLYDYEKFYINPYYCFSRGYNGVIEEDSQETALSDGDSRDTDSEHLPSAGSMYHLIISHVTSSPQC